MGVLYCGSDLILDGIEFTSLFSIHQNRLKKTKFIANI